MPDGECPVCRAPFNAYSVVDGGDETNQAEPGDYALCSQCAAVLVVTDGLGVAKLSKLQREMLENDRDMLAEITALQRVIRNGSASVN